MKRLSSLVGALLLTVCVVFAPAAHGQCDHLYPNGAVIGHAFQDQVIRNFVVPYRQSNFWIETVTVTQLQDGYNVAWLFEPRCRVEPPYCGIPSQIVCADLDCDLNVIAICVS